MKPLLCHLSHFTSVKLLIHNLKKFPLCVGGHWGWENLSFQLILWYHRSENVLLTAFESSLIIPSKTSKVCCVSSKKIIFVTSPTYQPLPKPNQPCNLSSLLMTNVSQYLFNALSPKKCVSHHFVVHLLLSATIC